MPIGKRLSAVILAGGEGLRLREILPEIPKPMAPVAGKPFLEYLVLQLVRWKIRDIILSVGYKGDLIAGYFGDGRKWGVKIRYCAEDEPLGTGGALREVLGLVGDEKFILMNGDSFVNIDLDQIVDFHSARPGIVTMGLVRLDDVSRYGKVDIDSSGRVTSFEEKRSGGPGLVNGGVYVVNRRIGARLPPGKCSLENDVLPALIPTGLWGMAVDAFFIDIGIPADYGRICAQPGLLQCRA